MQTQKSIILTPGNKEELDSWLRQNWVVKYVCPMPSSPANGWDSRDVQPTCLVIIEKLN